MTWNEVDRLVSEQKLEAAATAVAQILERARAEGDAAEWARALVEATKLRIALAGYETAVRRLLDEPWPQDAVSRAVLDLYTAHALQTYAQAYSWEIRQRERVVSDDEVELERWTMDQVVAAAHRSYARVWASRDGWGAAPIGELARYIRQGAFPARIRGTLRDAVSYLWVELLADTSLWRPEQPNELYRLDLEALLAGRPALDESALAEPRVHPLDRIALVLGDLERWHDEAGRPEAAHEARLERFRRLRDALEVAADLALIRDALAAAQEGLDPAYEWWAAGQAELARMIQAEDAADALSRARAVALAGLERHPKSLGGERCRHVVASIEAPSYSLAAMASDGVGRRSLRVEHANLGALHFRAFRYDLEAWLDQARDHNMLPGWREVPTFLAERTPDAEWSSELPATPDFRSHASDIVPPFSDPGAWIVVASARRDFHGDGNQLQAVHLVLGEPVLETRWVDGRWEVTVRSGGTGDVLPDAVVTLWRHDWRQGHRRVTSRRTGPDGRLSFSAGDVGRGTHFLLARWRDQLAFDPGALYAEGDRTPGLTSSVLVYTDRAVYRPQQTLHFKVVSYHGGGDAMRFAVVPGQQLTVRLRDANREVVAEAEVRTNDFGSASGRFEIPTGRMLGGWSLDTSGGGGAAVRVEEYKRPSFEVAVLDPARALRLNRPAELAGEAGYYFGLPVTEGAVRWRVTRERVVPPWWSWRWWRPEPAAPQMVASGDAVLDADGRFQVVFTPEADEREAAKEGVSYAFRLAVEVTDAGGETRSAERTFRLGFVTVQGRLETDAAFFLERRAATARLVRTDLDGLPRAGRARWRLVELVQPERALTPAQQPLPEPEDPEAYRTEGDRRRPRWDHGYDPRAVLASWPEGREVRSGHVEHGADGAASLELPKLAAGAYRLLWESDDELGATARARTDLVVVRDQSSPLAVPALLLAESSSVPVGGTARLLVRSGFANQAMVLELWRDGNRLERRPLRAGRDAELVEIPITEDLRGGFGATLTVLRDHQLMTQSASVWVPYDDRRLEVEFSTFRDRLRPGSRETFRVTVRGADEQALAAGAAEVLASMYDRSLDLFAPHSAPDALSLYPSRVSFRLPRTTLGPGRRLWSDGTGLASVPGWPHLATDRLVTLDGYGIGGPGRRGYGGGPVLRQMAAAPMAAMKAGEEADGMLGMVAESAPEAVREARDEGAVADAAAPPSEPAPVEMRSSFAETALFEPHLVTGDDGSVSFELEVPDSVTEWKLWIRALTRDLRAGAAERRLATVKELMVRPAVPRFLREGDRAELRVVVNNAAERALEGTVDLELVDPDTDDDLRAAFGLDPAAATAVPFRVEPRGTATLTFPIAVPPRPGMVAFRATARSGDLSDGELRPLPVLPGRMHLMQSRFVTLRDADRRKMVFEDLEADDDPSRIHNRMVLTVNAQLFYGVLDALPYLVDYPYECTEQTLNRFLSTGIVSSVFERYPAVARMSQKLADRETRYETWDTADPNRKMALEETPWLAVSRGGDDEPSDLLRVLDPRIAAAERRASLAKLERAQTSLGGFPWWPGGPPSPWMTLYILNGLSRALEFEVEVPQDVAVRAWRYMHRHYLDEIVRDMLEEDCCWETVTFLNYVLSNFPDESWTGGVFSEDDRRRMLEHSFRHWKRHSPLLKGYLALTLERAGRHDDAVLVFDSVMDSARTERDLGTYWAPEARSWLWYNDTIETHAFALRVLAELEPDDPRRDGLVQWLFLNKKLNHWKSTRATAEVIYSLVHYLEREGTLGTREEVRIAAGEHRRTFTFEPDEYTGSAARLVIPGDEVGPATATVVVDKDTPGLAFASATWAYSTEELPEEARGDLFEVHRSYFRRLQRGDELVLEPLAPGSHLAVGDQLEVHLTLRAKHAAEYVHLRDPRGSGFEPERVTSGYRWDLGIAAYEEVRDSGANFFIEWLPAGEYTLKHRLRAAMAGTFKVAPATLQSMYAPEFAAFSAGHTVEVRGE